MFKKEFDLLIGLPHAAQSEYLLMRSAMNWEDCIAGSNGEISWGGLATYLHVYGQPGISAEVFSKPQARRLAGHLIKRGLIKLLSHKGKRGNETDSLKIFFPVVAQCKSVQKKADSKPTAQADSKPTALKPHNTPLEAETNQESRQGQNDESRQISVICLYIYLFEKKEGVVVAELPARDWVLRVTADGLEEIKRTYNIPEPEIFLAEMKQWLLGTKGQKRIAEFTAPEDFTSWLHDVLRKKSREIRPGLPRPTRPVFVQPTKESRLPQDSTPIVASGKGNSYGNHNTTITDDEKARRRATFDQLRELIALGSQAKAKSVAH